MYDSRFEITFKNPALLGVEESFPACLIIVQNNNDRILAIINKELKEIDELAFYDMGGKQVCRANDIAPVPYLQYSTSGLSSGIYVVALKSNGIAVCTEKIIIQNQDWPTG